MSDITDAEYTKIENMCIYSNCHSNTRTYVQCRWSYTVLTSLAASTSTPHILQPDLLLIDTKTLTAKS